MVRTSSFLAMTCPQWHGDYSWGCLLPLSNNWMLLYNIFNSSPDPAGPAFSRLHHSFTELKLKYIEFTTSLLSYQRAKASLSSPLKWQQANQQQYQSRGSTTCTWGQLDLLWPCCGPAVTERALALCVLFQSSHAALKQILRFSSLTAQGSFGAYHPVCANQFPLRKTQRELLLQVHSSAW